MAQTEVGLNDLCFTHKLYPQATQKHILHINILVLLVIQIYFMCKLEEAILIKVTKITSTINWAFVNNNIIMKPLHPQNMNQTYISGFSMPRSVAQSRYVLQAINILSVPPVVIYIKMRKCLLLHNQNNLHEQQFSASVQVQRGIIIIFNVNKSQQ